MKKSLLLLPTVATFSLLAACGSDESEASNEYGELTLGATIPYSDMLEAGVKPYLEDLGYEVTITEFTDYIQPNLSLDRGDLDANLFQHLVYMEAFAEEHSLELHDVITVPTAPIGVYSNVYDSIDDIEPGSTVALANDPTNLARGLTVLRDNGLIEIDDSADPLRVTENDVKDNPLDLNFHPVEAAQLPRTLDSVELAAVNGNFAISAGFDLTTALFRDEIPADIINRVVVTEERADEQFVKDIIAAVESDEFREVIESDFQGFHHPDWMNE
ncbi:hypothetical protein FLK61_31260 [Paenalkalicoccus suaedae]|uniref:Lipoprotein n=1 Tax=Paenalkalicoccus suaedae TaxID=2592382 RepID=A0A859FF32_9BACI|nr:MetQ/NlpA family ABC transporter substrate-binding protein [Paenalkalicoccus suaedae]QKS71194.1 hypothetical protein FLK61_31260 [Paenalkalicoccus suaedae]